MKIGDGEKNTRGKEDGKRRTQNTPSTNNESRATNFANSIAKRKTQNTEHRKEDAERKT